MKSLKTIFLNAVVVLLVTFFLYGVIFLASYVVYPKDLNYGALDAKLANRTVFFSPPRYVLLGVHAIKRDNSQRIFLLGSSAVRDGFRPQELRRILSGCAVHNLAHGASNISEIQDIFENLAQIDSLSAGWSRTTVILGIFYGNFVDNQLLFRGTYNHIDIEKLRYGLYRERDGKLVPRFSQKCIGLWVKALRPVFFVGSRVNFVQERMIRMGHFFQSGLSNKKFDRHILINNDPSPRVVDEKYKRDALRQWKNDVNPTEDRLSEEQFIVLQELIKEILKTGARLVVLDIPLPQWHRARSPFFKTYREQVRNCLATIDSEAFLYVDLSASIPDDQFIDSVHPVPAATYELASLLAGKIKYKAWDGNEVKP